MPNRPIRFTVTSLVFLILGMGWQTALASAVYLPHRLLPAFVPASADAGVASFTPRYRFRPQRSQRSASVRGDTRLPAFRPLGGNRFPVRQAPYQAAVGQWPHGFRYRPLPTGMMAAYNRAAHRALQPRFAPYPSQPVPRIEGRFASRSAPWGALLPVGAVPPRRLAPRPVPTGRYQAGRRTFAPPHWVAGYRFRPVSEPARRVAAGRMLPAWQSVGFPAVPGWRFRPLAHALTPPAQVPHPAAPAISGGWLAPPQPGLAYRFRPDPRFATVGRGTVPAAFAGMGYANRPLAGYGRAPAANPSQPLVWRPLDERKDRLVRQTQVGGEYGTFMSIDPPQPGYPVVDGHL